MSNEASRTRGRPRKVSGVLPQNGRRASARGRSDLGTGARRQHPTGLLDLDLRALLLEGRLDLLGLVAGDALLDGLRRRVDEVLGLLEAEAGQLADDLDDRDLVRADLGQRRGELGLLLGSGRRFRRAAGGGWSGC